MPVSECCLYNKTYAYISDASNFPVIPSQVGCQITFYAFDNICNDYHRIQHPENQSLSLKLSLTHIYVKLSLHV